MTHVGGRQGSLTSCTMNKNIYKNIIRTQLLTGKEFAYRTPPAYPSSSVLIYTIDCLYSDS